jgi:hypothetical protein
MPAKFNACRANVWNFGSSVSLDAHGVVRHVFLQVREDQEKFEHAVPLVRIWLVRAFFEILDHGEGIGKKPFEVVGSDRFTPAEILQSAVGPNERLIEKMIEAELLGNQPYRNRAGTPRPAAWGGRCGVHDLLHFLGLNFLRGIEKPSIFSFGQWAMRVKRQ